MRDTKAQYTIRADVPADYCRVAITLKDEGRLPRTVLHLWGITDDGVENRLHRPLGLHLDAGYHSLFHAVRSLALDAEHHEVEVVAVTNDAQCAIGTEKARPLSALATGPVLVIPKEFAGITCRTVDISLSTHDDLAQWAQWVLEELADPDGAPLVALRGGSRWVRATRQIRLGQPSYAHVAIGANRHFLITGGLGGIGLTFAKYLAASAKAKLTLIGRSTVPGRKTWDALLASGDTSSRLRQQLAGIRECEATGGEVLVISADVADFEQMRSAKRQAEERFGAVNAVIHAAGVPDGRSIALKTAGQAEDILRSKVLGTTVLDALFGDGCLDFMLLCSSLTALFGEYGQADYCSANAFLDAFAHQQRPSGRRVVAVNWDVWQGVGMAEDAQLPGDLQRRRKKHVETGITPAEGVEALLRVLASPLPQVIVSACPIEERAMASGMLPSDLYREDTSGESGHDRPDLHTPYQAPAGDVEVEVAGVWQEVLGINGIGRNDDFIELGGHSLLAAQVVARIEERLGVRLSMPTMLAHPTVAHLAACVTASGAPSRMPVDPVTETDIEYEEFEL